MSTKLRLILDIDNSTGIPARDVDDGLTLALALASPEVEILGITTCAGNCRTFQSTDNTLRQLDLAGRGDIPVAAGRENPLLLDVSASFDFLEGQSASPTAVEIWRDLELPPPARNTAIELPAHEFIIQQVRQYPGEVTFVMAGSLTNLAVALTIDPDIAPMIKQVVHMGGDLSPWWEIPAIATSRDDGDLWRYVIRMNTEYDPEATAIVVSSGVDFTFVTSQVSGRVFIRPDDVGPLTSAGTKFHDFLGRATAAWVRWQIEDAGRVGAQLWDPLTLAVVLQPDLCRYANLHCDLDRFRAWDYPWLVASSKSPKVRVTMDVDEQRAEAFMLDRISSGVITERPGT